MEPQWKLWFRERGKKTNKIWWHHLDLQVRVAHRGGSGGARHLHVYHEARAKVPPFNAIEFERQVGSNDHNGYTDRDGNDSALAEKPAASAKLLAPDRVEREGRQSVSKGAAILASPPLPSPIGAQ
jgi:hypothetical protein